MSRLSNTFAEEIKKNRWIVFFFFLFFCFSSIFSAHTYTNTHTQFSHTFVCVCFNVAVLTSFFGALWPRSVDAPWGVFLFHLMVLPHTHVVQLLQAALQLLLQKKLFLFKYTCSKIYSFIFVIDFFVCFFFCKHWVIQSFFHLRYWKGLAVHFCLFLNQWPQFVLDPEIFNVLAHSGLIIKILFCVTVFYRTLCISCTCWHLNTSELGSLWMLSSALM